MAWVVAGAVSFAALLFFLLGGAHLAPRPLPFVAGTVLGWATIALAATWIAFWRGHSMLGRHRAWLAAVVVATPAVLFGWMLLWNVRYPETMADWPGRVGFRCLGFTLAMAAWPLLALAWVRRERDPLHPGLSGAARGVAVGALGGVVVDVWCPIANPWHVLLGHVAPMLVLLAIGLVVGRAVSGVRAR
jgi:hypothetical protein